MGAELLIEGLDGAYVSNETLTFHLDICKQSGSHYFDKVVNKVTKNL